MECEREPVPHKRGDKEAPATVRRGKDHARIVITVEVKLSPEKMGELPNHQKHAADYLRTIADDIEIYEIDKDLHYRHGVEVLNTKVEIAP